MVDAIFSLCLTYSGDVECSIYMHSCIVSLTIYVTVIFQDARIENRSRPRGVICTWECSRLLRLRYMPRLYVKLVDPTLIFGPGASREVGDQM